MKSFISYFVRGREREKESCRAVAFDRNSLIKMSLYLNTSINSSLTYHPLPSPFWPGTNQPTEFAEQYFKGRNVCRAFLSCVLGVCCSELACCQTLIPFIIVVLSYNFFGFYSNITRGGRGLR